jgi:hypothetical protein
VRATLVPEMDATREEAEGKETEGSTPGPSLSSTAFPHSPVHSTPKRLSRRFVRLSTWMRQSAAPAERTEVCWREAVVDCSRRPFGPPIWSTIKMQYRRLGTIEFRSKLDVAMPFISGMPDFCPPNFGSRIPTLSRSFLPRNHTRRAG